MHFWAKQECIQKARNLSNRPLILNAQPRVTSAARTGVTGRHHVTHAFYRRGKIGSVKVPFVHLTQSHFYMSFTIFVSHTVINQ